MDRKSSIRQAFYNYIDTFNIKLLISDKDKPMIQTNVHQPIEAMFVKHLHKMMHYMQLQISLILQAAKQHSCVHLLCFHVLAWLLLYS